MDLSLCAILLPILWLCSHSSFSTIFGKWFKQAGFTLMILWGDILSTWPSIAYQFGYFILQRKCTLLHVQAYVKWSQIVGDKPIFGPSFPCPHELASTWTHGRSNGLPTLLGTTKCTHQGGAYKWFYKNPRTLKWTYSPNFQAF